MDYRAELCRRLGLPEDATDEQIQQAQAENDPPEVPETPETPETGEDEEEEEETEVEPEQVEEPVAASDGTIRVDPETWRQTREQAQQGAEARRQQVESDDNRLLDDAIKAGKFPPSRRDHYREAIKADRDGTRQLIASLADGLVPVDERGASPAEDSLDSSGYPAEWLPEVAARNGGKSPITQEA